MYETFQVNADIVLTQTAPDWLLANTQFHQTSTGPLFGWFGRKFGNGMRLAGLLGYEVDRMFGNAPVDTIRIAHSPYRHGRRIRYADMTLYTTASRAIVFATGSMQWAGVR